MPRSRSPLPRRHTRSRSRHRDRESYRTQDHERDRKYRSRDDRRHVEGDRRDSSRRRRPSRAPPASRSSRNYSPPARDSPSTRGTSKDARSLSTTTPALAPAEKEKPNFSATGVLAAAANTVNNVVLKYHEPPDSRLPPSNPAWRVFIFKGEEIVDTVELNSRSCWLLGRDRAVADVPVDHPSCSKQHAVLQFRHVVKTDEFGEKKAGVRLYVMDLESANGTILNGDEIEPRRYVECLKGDLLRFGLSTREYVVMLEDE